MTPTDPQTPTPPPAPLAPAARASEPAGPAWLVVPARVVALIVVVPIRLVYDVVRAGARGVRAGWRALMRAPAGLGWLARALWAVLYGGLLGPIVRAVAMAGRAVAAVFGWLGHGVAGLFDLLLVRPLRWLAIVVILGALRLLGRGTGSAFRWIHRVLLAPVGRLLAAIGSAIAATFRLLGRGLDFVLLRPLRALGRGVVAVLRAIGTGIAAIGAGLAWVLGWTGHVLLSALKAIGAALAWVLMVTVVMPATLLWRYVLGPVVAGLGWILRTVARGVGAAGDAVAWAWKMLGRGLSLLGRVLFATPARALRWLWRVLVVTPVRGAWHATARTGHVLFVVPARWFGRSVLRPVGAGLGTAWRRSVREPARAVRLSARAARQSVAASMRDARRDVRAQMRRAFRR